MVRSTLLEAARGARLVAGLPAYLRRRLSPEQAREALEQRLEQREAAFLQLVRRAYAGRGATPYHELLRAADCEFGDVHRLVRLRGVEGALEALRQDGVYLTVDEWKGRVPVRRGSQTFQVEPDGYRNRAAAGLVPASTSGSRSRGTATFFDLAFVRECASDTCLYLAARGGADWDKAIWEAPGGAAMFRVLKYSSFGRPGARWFTQIPADAPGLHPRYRWSARALSWGSLLAGAPLPRPEHVPLEAPLPIARWMVDALRQGRTPYLQTFVSSGVRLAQAAERAGLDLAGGRLLLVGEPFTAARAESVRRAGLEARPRYGSVETGPVGYGCLRPTEPDEVHLLDDLHAVIQAGSEPNLSGLPPDALLISSLSAAAPFVLLNVSMGDRAELRPSGCGCPLEQLGWARRAARIRSFEKLTAGGMTFLDRDVVKVLEETLPARFGGGPTHYQLVEDEAEDGRPRLRLLVHPAVGRLDLDEVREAFLQQLGAGSGAERIMALSWREAGLPAVERRPPLTTANGKLQQLHRLLGGAADRGGQAEAGGLE